MKALFKILTFSFLSVFAVMALHAQTQIGDDINGVLANFNLGWAVSMPSANYVLVGEPGYASNKGRALVYEWNGSTWTQKGGSLLGEDDGDKFGTAVTMPDETTLAVGGYLNDANDPMNQNYGHVRVYQWVVDQWAQKGADIDGENPNDLSGQAISMPDANTIAIGAPDNSWVGLDAGHVRIFEWNETAWVQKGSDIDGADEYDNFGFAVSMPDANTVAISGTGNDSVAQNAGHVQVYEWDGSIWVQKGMDILGENEDDKIGTSVSMPDADHLAIGSHLVDANGVDAGLVQIYEWNGTAWLQIGSDIVGEVAGDLAGFSVSMPDINTIAVGSNNSDSLTISDTGNARIFSWDGTNWVQEGTTIYGEAAYDYSGRSVSMPNANTIAIGASLNDSESHSNSGHVRVYTLCVPVFGTHTVSACDSYIWINGTTYYADNSTDTHTIVGGASNGCDSIVTLNLTMNEAATGVHTVSACEEFIWIDGNTYYDSNNTATYTIIEGAANGCDSIVTLNLTMNFTVFGTDILDACDEFTWIDGNTYYDDNTTATHNIVEGAATGCDSIVTLNLTMNESATGVDEISACDEYTWIDGITYEESNNTATFTISEGAINGCDSVVTLDLTIIEVDNSVTQMNNTLTANLAGADYQWLDCNDGYAILPDEINQSFTATENGDYAVEITHNDCVDTSLCQSITSVNIIENDFGTNLRLYPNPTDGNFSIDMGKKYPSLTLVLSEISGKIIRTLFFNEKQILNMKLNEPAGIYMIMIDSGDEKATIRLIKQ
ncbi:MAG: T9SS type A sorting domain-containing protein [Bacteroidales bacterium]|jgi:hypothetical protein|nr:T9SS type A sorting domain-containing protein [Bacteroidales bacterium]